MIDPAALNSGRRPRGADDASRADRFRRAYRVAWRNGLIDALAYPLFVLVLTVATAVIAVGHGAPGTFARDVFRQAGRDSLVGGAIVVVVLPLVGPSGAAIPRRARSIRFWWAIVDHESTGRAAGTVITLAAASGTAAYREAARSVVAGADPRIVLSSFAHSQEVRRCLATHRSLHDLAHNLEPVLERDAESLIATVRRSCAALGQAALLGAGSGVVWFVLRVMVPLLTHHVGGVTP